MKRTIMILLLTFSILGFSAYNLFCMYRAKTEAISGLTQATEYIEQKNYEKAAETVNAVFEMWKEKEETLRLFTRRNYVDEAADVLAELPPLAREKDESAFLGRVEKAKNIIEHIWENEIPSINTLF